jgi:cyclopropane fatty-acyl-phospholipid synthase-like methyltransferase
VANVNAVADARLLGTRVADPMFDLVFPSEQRLRSWVHWTPIEIATRACQLLAWKPEARVLDVGSGVGKLCLVGALTTDARWFGVEHDGAMVEAARIAAATLGVEDRTRFFHGDAMALEWSSFDAFYLFNPFAERFMAARHDDVSARDAYLASVDAVQRRLATTKLGSRVVTYYGFGGALPPGFRLIHREAANEDQLCMWERQVVVDNLG